VLEAVLYQLAQQASVVDTRPAPAHITVAPAWYRPVTLQCIVQEAERQQLEVVKLAAVLKTEAGRVGQFIRSSDGSYDIGPGGINTIHLPELARTFGIPQATVAQLLGYDGCFNVAVSSWLLRKRTNEAKGDFWYGVGFYHSKTPQYTHRYILRVHDTMRRMLAPDQRATAVPSSSMNAAGG
jgi:hypothetical protein